MVALRQEAYYGDFSYNSSHLLELCRTVVWVARLVIAALQGEPFVEKLGGNLLDIPRGRLQQYSAHWNGCSSLA